MKEFKFTKYLVYLLYDHKQVVIPGVGLFTLHRHNASQKAGEQTIVPPSYSIHFQQDSSLFIEDSFMKKLRMYQPSISKKEYIDYANEIVNTLDKEKQVVLGNLGNIYKKDDNILYTFASLSFQLTKLSSFDQPFADSESIPMFSLISNFISAIAAPPYFSD